MMTDEKMSKQLIPVPEGRFKTIAFKKFEPKGCIAILADERDAYGGLKKVLYAGTCIWMIAPKNPDLIKGAIKLAALKTLSEAEETTFIGTLPHSVASDMQARYVVLGKDFIKEIYYTLGGALGLASAPSIQAFRATIADESPRLDYAIAVVQIYHHHVLELSEARYGKPSLNKAADLIAELGIKHGDHKSSPQSRYVKTAWAESRESIAFLYAASTIETDDGRTLLEKFKQGDNNLFNDKKYILTLLGRAKYVIDCILSRCAEKETFDENDWVLPRSIKQQMVAAPVFSDAQRDTIRRKFSQSAV